MRNNQPVTQQEYPVPAHATLMSTTDTRGHITYANEAFIEASGFAREELLGQPHNLVRHPDMPAVAFADMWATLLAGRSWTAVVKNRRKNGDHYWVRANATPILRDGKVSGFMSVRTRAEPAEVAQARALHDELRAGRSNRKFHQGLLVRDGALGWLSWSQVMPLRWRLRLALAALGTLAVAGAAVAGLPTAALAVHAGIVAALCGAASAFLEAQIARPLNVVLQQALHVAAGQPAANMQLNRVDEIGLVLRAITQAGLNLRSLVDDVGGQVGGVQVASTEIAQGNGDLSTRTEQAAANLQETAASMEEMTATVRHNADAARQAAQLASDASAAATSGGQVVSQVVATMQDITASSQRMADIISVIDGIAFQTNILALNASVEAARAGVQGRGFAVVASEVRSLAQRSAEAARQIKVLIDTSVEKVENGARHADDSGRVMGDIVSKVQRVNDLIGEISHATHEQSGGIGEVSTAVTQLDKMTQQNAALVEQSAAAAELLKCQAVRLAESVQVFKT